MRVPLLMLWAGAALVLGCDAGRAVPDGHAVVELSVESAVLSEEGLRYYVRLVDEDDETAAVVAVSSFDDSPTAVVPEGRYRVELGEQFCPDRGCPREATASPPPRQRFVACPGGLAVFTDQTVTLHADGTAESLTCQIVASASRQQG